MCLESHLGARDVFSIDFAKLCCAVARQLAAMNVVVVLSRPQVSIVYEIVLAFIDVF
jgi:hypothetical protein